MIDLSNRRQVPRGEVTDQRSTVSGVTRLTGFMAGLNELLTKNEGEFFREVEGPYIPADPVVVSEDDPAARRLRERWRRAAQEPRTAEDVRRTIQVEQANRNFNTQLGTHTRRVGGNEYDASVEDFLNFGLSGITGESE